MTGDKIRILWIDDREWISGFPERALPEEYAGFFEVVHPRSSNDAAMSYDSANAFIREFVKFWSTGANQEYFPAEILALDYNLSKRSAADRLESASRPLSIRNKNSILSEELQEAPLDPYASVSSRVNFDGLLIGSFYATLTHRHPAALVSITNYDGEMPPEVHTLRTLITPFLSVATRSDSDQWSPSEPVWHNLRAPERSWKNIISAAAPPLRDRIETLHRKGDISISPEDVEALLHQPIIATHLRIASPYGSRRLPLAGLFADFWHDEELLQHEKAAFGRRLISVAFVDSEVYRLAKELAGQVWSAYEPSPEPGEDLIEERHELSNLLQFGNTDDETVMRRLKALKEKFKVKRGRCHEHLCDVIRHHKSRPELTDEVRRWAALLLLFQFLRRAVKIRARVRLSLVALARELNLPEDYPVLSSEDLYLVFFPLPKEAVLPAAVDKSHGWARSLNKLNRDGMVSNNVGDLCFHVPDVLAGYDWSATGPHGLRQVERQFLQGLVLQEQDLSRHDWMDYGPARRIIWGHSRGGAQ